MRENKKLWELYLWLPTVLVLSAFILIASCNENEHKKDTAPSRTKKILKTQVGKTQQQTDIKTAAEKTPEHKTESKHGNNGQKPSGSHSFAKLKSDFTGELAVCVSNDTFGWVEPCG